MERSTFTRWLMCAAAAAAPLMAGARITSISIDSVKPFADGMAFGDGGAYERVTGVAHGELDPADPHNRGIVNLDKAPKNAAGKVEYTVDVDMLRPVNGGNRKLLFEVTNRGRKFLLHWVLDGAGPTANNPLTATDAGNALLLRQGWTIVWTGWDPEAPKAGNGMTIRVPVAKNGDATIVRVIRDELVSATRGPVLREFKLSYDAASLAKGDATLTVRRKEGDARVDVPASEWEFADARTLRILTPGNAGAGPAVGSLYELHYPARDPKGWASALRRPATSCPSCATSARPTPPVPASGRCSRSAFRKAAATCVTTSRRASTRTKPGASSSRAHLQLTAERSRTRPSTCRPGSATGATGRCPGVWSG